MKTIYPKYAKKFICIASDCPDTCCAGWEVAVDKQFQEIYKRSSSPVAKKAVDAMYTDSDSDVCLRLNKGRCPMLNENNLCELYIHMGSDALCDVCRVYPRYNKDFSDVIFSGISLSCPESARLILSDNENGALNERPYFADEASALIFDIYLFMAHNVKSDEFFALSEICEHIQDEMDFGDYSEARKAMVHPLVRELIPHAAEIADIANNIRKMEFLTDEWAELVKLLTNHLNKAIADEEYCKKRDAAFSAASHTGEITDIKIYYLFKYLPEAMEYGDIVSLYERCRTCTMLICELYAMEILNKGKIDFDRRLRLAQLFSKEIEHNEDNLAKIIE